VPWFIARYANRHQTQFGLHMLKACINEEGAEKISQRTKAALAAAKARGQKLGSPNPRAGGLAVSVHLRARKAATIAKVMPIVRDLQGPRHDHHPPDCRGFNPAGHPNGNRRYHWHSAQVSRLLAA
jgi:hypothetical protein